MAIIYLTAQDEPEARLLAKSVGDEDCVSLQNAARFFSTPPLPQEITIVTSNPEAVDQQLTEVLGQLYKSDTDKDKLEHLYLLMPNAGKKIAGGEKTVAEDLAITLDNARFHKLQLHAVMPAKNTEMQVSLNQGKVVVSIQGSQWSANPENTFYNQLNTRLANRVKELKEKPNQSYEEQRELACGQEFLARLGARRTAGKPMKLDLPADYRQEMKRDYNTFRYETPVSKIRCQAERVSDSIVALTLLRHARKQVTAEIDWVEQTYGTQENTANLGAKQFGDKLHAQAQYLDGRIQALEVAQKSGLSSIQFLLQSDNSGHLSQHQLQANSGYQRFGATILDIVRKLNQVPVKKAAVSEQAKPTDSRSAALPPSLPAQQVSQQHQAELKALVAGVRHEHPSARVQSNPNQRKIDELTRYIEQRKTEWSYHRNFLGIVGLVYLIQDKLTGSDHFNSKNRDTKISAAEKLKTQLESGQQVDLNPSEQKALSDGRLGQIAKMATEPLPADQHDLSSSLRSGS